MDFASYVHENMPREILDREIYKNALKLVTVLLPMIEGLIVDIAIRVCLSL